MRVKNAMDAVPFMSSIKTVWERITFSKLTLAYFLFTLLHFVLQLAFQVKAFTVNVSAANFLGDLVAQGNFINKSVPILDGNQLRLCSWVPANLKTNVDSCQLIWDGGKGSNSLQGGIAQANNSDAAYDVLPSSSKVSTSSATSSSVSAASTVSTASATTSPVTIAPAAKARPTQTVTVIVQPTPTLNLAVTPSADANTETATEDDSTDAEDQDNLRKRDVSPGSPKIPFTTFIENGQVKVNMTGFGYNNSPATLDTKCLLSLTWPANSLYNTKREDIVFILFQFWVLGMSVVALLNESIPHIIAAMVTHILATAWGVFQIHNTAVFRSNFSRVITQGTCNGVPLLTHYWEARSSAEIPSVALNAFALVLSGWLTWRLMKLYGWQTFKRVGASIKINRIYKLVLTLSIFIQLSLFFIIVTVSLWLDQLLNSGIGDLVVFLKLYKVSSIITLSLSLPWFLSGWFGVRRELRAPMFCFLFLSIMYLAGWSVMFFSTTFRWTFLTWRFFSVMASSSVFLTTGCFILGVICRFNFGKGLIRYLNAQEALPGDDFLPYQGSDAEKVAFPSNDAPIPTFSAAFGSGDEVPPPNQMFSATSRMGPRFFNQVASPFEKRVSSSSQQSGHLTPPLAALSRTGSIDSNHSSATITRVDSHGSGRSSPSFYTYNRTEGTSVQQSKRWVIE